MGDHHRISERRLWRSGGAACCRVETVINSLAKQKWGKMCEWSNYLFSHYFYAAKRIFVKTAVPVSPHSYFVQCTKRRPFSEYCKYEGNPKIARDFEKYSSYEQTEYLCNITETTQIEPQYGFVVTKNHTYFKESVPYCDDTMTPPPFVLNKRCVRNNIYLDEAISIRYGWNNYWHFFNDALGTLIFIQGHVISKDIPIVVPEQALRHHYVREVLKNHEYFKKLTFVFQSSNQWIECKNIWFGKVLPNTKANLLRVQQLIDLREPRPVLQNKKIFVTRSGSNRSLSNLDTIEKIAEFNGFSVVDTARLDVAVQKVMFESAKAIVGLHGAGLANLIFSHGSTPKVVEIFPGNSIPPHYYWLSRELGYGYRALLGSDQNKDGKYFLDENSFTEAIKKL